MVSFHEYCNPNIIRLFGQKPIITKIHLNLSLILCHISVSEFLTLLVSISFFTLAYVYILDAEITTYLIVNLFFLFVIQQVFAYSIGVIFGVVNVFYRDVKEFLLIFMNIWFWLTPIVWVPSIAPPLVAKSAESNKSVFLVS